MRAAFSKPVFDREKCIAIIPARIADTKTAHIFYGSAVLTLLGLVPALFEYQNYFSVFMIGAFIFVSIFFISIFVRNHTRRNPEIMIDNAGVIFSGLIGKKFFKWTDISQIKQGYMPVFLYSGTIGIVLRLYGRGNRYEGFLLPVMKWKARDHFFFILKELSIAHDFELSITEPAIWHDADG